MYGKTGQEGWRDSWHGIYSTMKPDATYRPACTPGWACGRSGSWQQHWDLQRWESGAVNGGIFSDAPLKSPVVHPEVPGRPRITRKEEEKREKERGKKGGKMDMGKHGTTSQSVQSVHSDLFQ